MMSQFKLGHYLSIGLLFLMTIGCVPEQKSTDGVIVITPTEALAMLEQDSDIQLLDVRTAKEYAGGTIPGAVNMDILAADFASKAASLDKSRPVVVFCKLGSRSVKAAQFLEQQGFGAVYDIKGGILQYQKEVNQ